MDKVYFYLYGLLAIGVGVTAFRFWLRYKEVKKQEENRNAYKI